MPPLALPRRIVVSDADIQAAIDTLRSFRAAVKAATAGSRSLARARLRAADRGAGNAESRRPASASAAPGGGGATGRSAFLRDAAPGDIADSSRMHGGSTTRRSEADFRMLFRSNTAPTGLDTQRSTPRFGGIGEPPDRSGAVSTSTSTPGSTRSWGYGRGADAGAKGVHDDTVDGEPPFTGTAAEEPGSHASLSPPRRASFIGSVPGVLISGDGLRGSIVGRGRDVDTLSRASKRDLDAGQAAAAAAIDGVSAVASQIGPGLE